MNEPLPIINPWVIMHQPGGPGTPVETILGMGESHEAFGLAIADLVGHVAKAFNVEEADVMEWVNRELENRTTEIVRTGPQ